MSSIVIGTLYGQMNFTFFNNIGITAMFEGLLEYHQGDGMTFAGVYQYAVYPWFMTLLFIVAGVAAYHTLQHKTAKQFISGRRNKLLIPSTLGVLVFGFISGSIVVNASGAEGLQATPGFVKYIVYTLSGIGAQWFSQMLFVISLLLLLVRKVVLAVQKEERKSIQRQADDGFVESNGQKVNESETWKEYTGIASMECEIIAGIKVSSNHRHLGQPCYLVC